MASALWPCGRLGIKLRNNEIRHTAILPERSLVSLLSLLSTMGTCGCEAVRWGHVRQLVRVIRDICWKDTFDGYDQTR